MTLGDAIFQALEEQLRPDLERALKDQAPDRAEAALKESLAAWRRLATAIATGVTRGAQSFSSAAEDPAFWQWQAVSAQVWRTWAGSPNAGLPELKAALLALYPDDRPSSITGRVR